jgi:hypothetical protein
MANQITLEEALELVEFRKDRHGKWYAAVVKGNCNLVKGNCDIVEGDCGTVVGNCHSVKGDCHSVKGDCDIVEGLVITVEGNVWGKINGRKWQYVETPKERFERLLGETENKKLIEAFKQLEDNQ